MTRRSLAFGFALVVITQVLDRLDATDQAMPPGPTIIVYKGPT
jgi:hypothetical protein